MQRRDKYISQLSVADLVVYIYRMHNFSSNMLCQIIVTWPHHAVAMPMHAVKTQLLSFDDNLH